MLGRLAKWLRLLGYDTLYAGDASDHQIVAMARAEGRAVLTRDVELARRKGIACLLIHSQVLEAQLAQVIAAYGPVVPRDGALVGGEFVPAVPRCPACNGVLVTVPKEQARAHVPVYVWETHGRFHRCLGCDKLYWPGSHWERIQSTLARILRHEGSARAKGICESLAEGTVPSSRP